MREAAGSPRGAFGVGRVRSQSPGAAGPGGCGGRRRVLGCCGDGGCGVVQGCGVVGEQGAGGGGAGGPVGYGVPLGGDLTSIRKLHGGVQGWGKLRPLCLITGVKV